MNSTLANPATVTAALPGAPFRERHQRVVAAPIEEVWPHCLAVAARDIRALGPLMALRTLPSRLRLRRGTDGPTASLGTEARPLLDVFADEGFVLLRRDDESNQGRAVVLFGAAGRFWSLTDNAPIRFDSPADFLAFDTPGHAKTVASLEAVDLGDGTTRLETETVVDGTDPASTRKFAPYWALIRLPSGLIRRSWLAAVARRVERARRGRR